MIRPSCVMILSDESRSFIAEKILQWMDVIFIVLLSDLIGEINCTIIGGVYLSFTNFISVACLIILFLMSLLYGLGVVRLSLVAVIESSSGGSSVIVSSPFSVVIASISVFGCNF